MADSNSERPARTKNRRWMIAGVLGLIACATLAWVFRASLAEGFAWLEAGLRRFVAWVEGLGAIGPIVFILGYAALTVLLVPGAIMTLGAGAVFGLTRGVVYVFIAAALGAAAAFLVARYVAGGWVRRKVAGSERFAAIDRAIEGRGLQITALLRLSPVFPFNFLNYALGLTRVRFLHYNLASLAMLPGTFLYVYYGSLGKVEDGGWKEWARKIVGLVATIAVTAVITRLARRALREATDASAERAGN